MAHLPPEMAEFQEDLPDAWTAGMVLLNAGTKGIIKAKAEPIKDGFVLSCYDL